MSELKDDQFLKTSFQRQKVLVFSPHPDDDVISMGGTMNKLKNQGHHVIVAYMTTGSNSVHDYETMKYLHMMKDVLKYANKLKGGKD
jgi:glucosamine-6-phosphate deaminase